MSSQQAPQASQVPQQQAEQPAVPEISKFFMTAQQRAEQLAQQMAATVESRKRDAPATGPSQQEQKAPQASQVPQQQAEKPVINSYFMTAEERAEQLAQQMGKEESRKRAAPAAPAPTPVLPPIPGQIHLERQQPMVTPPPPQNQGIPKRSRVEEGAQAVNTNLEASMMRTAHAPQAPAPTPIQLARQQPMVLPLNQTNFAGYPERPRMQEVHDESGRYIFQAQQATIPALGSFAPAPGSGLLQQARQHPMVLAPPNQTNFAGYPERPRMNEVHVESGRYILQGQQATFAPAPGSFASAPGPFATAPGSFAPAPGPFAPAPAPGLLQQARQQPMVSAPPPNQTNFAGFPERSRMNKEPQRCGCGKCIIPQVFFNNQYYTVTALHTYAGFLKATATDPNIPNDEILAYTQVEVLDEFDRLHAIKQCASCPKFMNYIMQFEGWRETAERLRQSLLNRTKPKSKVQISTTSAHFVGSDIVRHVVFDDLVENPEIFKKLKIKENVPVTMSIEVKNSANYFTFLARTLESRRIAETRIVPLSTYDCTLAELPTICDRIRRLQFNNNKIQVTLPTQRDFWIDKMSRDYTELLQAKFATPDFAQFSGQNFGQPGLQNMPNPTPASSTNSANSVPPYF